MFDLYSNLKAQISIIPAVKTADATGSTIDLTGYNGATMVFEIGTPGDTLSPSVYFELKIQESDDGSTWSVVNSENLLGGTPKIDANGKASQSYLVGYIGSKRYIRAFVDFTGTHTVGTIVGATALLGFPRHK